jgi:hypothetical protein
MMHLEEEAEVQVHQADWTRQPRPVGVSVLS